MSIPEGLIMNNDCKELYKLFFNNFLCLIVVQYIHYNYSSKISIQNNASNIKLFHKDGFSKDVSNKK